MAERTFRDGVRAMAPLVVAVLGFAISFGVLARAAGFGWFAPIVMSATTFAGSAQFASVSVLGDGGTVAAAVAAAAFFFRGKNSSVDPTLVNGALRLPRIVLGGQIVICAHLWRKLTGANFSGKTARLTRVLSIQT
mgnify:CR=1 FL=1